MTEPVVAIPIASLPVAAVVVAAVVVTPLVVTAIVVTIVATLVTVTVAIVGLRGSDDATDERERQGSSSNQTFHFDLPDSPDEPAWGALSAGTPDRRLNVFRQLPFSLFLLPVAAVTRYRT
jgi:hypothetical protein